MENKLHLPLTYHWFKEIESGRKSANIAGLLKAGESA